MNEEKRREKERKNPGTNLRMTQQYSFTKNCIYFKQQFINIRLAMKTPRGWFVYWKLWHGVTIVWNPWLQTVGSYKTQTSNYLVFVRVKMTRRANINDHKRIMNWIGAHTIPIPFHSFFPIRMGCTNVYNLPRWGTKIIIFHSSRVFNKCFR